MIADISFQYKLASPYFLSCLIELANWDYTRHDMLFYLSI